MFACVFIEKMHNYDQNGISYSVGVFTSVGNMQSGYKAGHSCETALLRVYNHNINTIGRGNGAMLGLLYLYSAFDTIYHDNLFYILEKY